MRNVYIVTQNYPPAKGGMPILMQNIAEKLSKHYTVKVLTFLALNTSPFFDRNDKNIMIKKENETLNGIPIERFAFTSKYHQIAKWVSGWAYKFKLPIWGRLRFLEYGPVSPGFKKYVVENVTESDTIIAGSYPLNFMNDLSMLKQKIGFKLIFIPAIHAEDQYWFANHEIYHGMNVADSVVCFTEYESNHIKANNVSTEIHVLGIGANPPTDSKPMKRSSDSNINLSYIGSFGASKGIDDLVEVFARLGHEFPNLYLTIAGAETQFTCVIKTKIGKLTKDLRSRIDLYLNISELEKYEILSNTDIFVSASGYESFGITFIESWSQKVPVVSTRNGSIPYVIDENHNGVLVDFKDLDELYIALRELILDPEYRRKLGKNGYAKFINTYNWDTIIQKYIDIIEKAYERT